MVLARGSCIFHCAQNTDVYLSYGFVTQLGLCSEVANVQVHVVVGQFVKDVEWRVVARIELVSVERARGVDRTRLGIDGELAAYGTRNHVCSCAQCSRCLLLAVASRADKVQL